MATEVHTYNGNKTYDAEFNDWFYKWFDKIAEEIDWEIIYPSFISDQQKEQLFLAFQQGLTENLNSNLFSEKEHAIVQEIDLKLRKKIQEFPDWLDEFGEKYNFTDIGDFMEELLFGAFFENDQHTIHNIVKKYCKEV